MSIFPVTSASGCLDFSHAKVGEARALQVPQAIPSENDDTLSGFSCRKMRFFMIFLVIPCIKALPLPACHRIVKITKLPELQFNT
jgi:hypothetical protein